MLLLSRREEQMPYSSAWQAEVIWCNWKFYSQLILILQLVMLTKPACRQTGKHLSFSA